MAKRRSHKKHGRRRHRRVGAFALKATSPMVQAGSVALGFLLADKINPMVDKLAGTMDAKIVAGIQVGLGTALVMRKIGKSTATVAVGGVLAGAGLKRGLRAFGVITGYGMVPVIGGYQKVPVVSGYYPSQSLNGYQVGPGAINATKPLHSKIMGSVNPGTEKTNGSGITSGSELLG